MSKDNSRSCVVSGTFDPMTVGHRDIIMRAAKMFDVVHVLVAKTSSKPGHLLTYDEKVKQLQNDLNEIKNFQIHPIENALVDQAHALGAKVIVRGLRNEQDLIYEMDMSSVNRMLDGNIETVYLPCKPELSYVSSSMVRELCRLGKWDEASKYSSYFATKLIKRHLTKVIAITGSIGCGKSQVQAIFKKNGWEVMDLDEENENAVLRSCDCSDKICEQLLTIGFDVRISKTCNVIDKKKLANAIVSDAKARQIVEIIAWPKLIYQVKEFISDWTWHDNVKVAIQVPLLFEKGTEEFLKMFDKTVCIVSKHDVQLKRLVETRGYSLEHAKKRIAMQMDAYEKAKMCDFVIENNGSLDELETNTEKILSQL